MPRAFRLRAFWVRIGSAREARCNWAEDFRAAEGGHRAMIGGNLVRVGGVGFFCSGAE